jgi:hypothetical protein
MTRQEGGESLRTKSPTGRSQVLALTKRRGTRPQDLDRQDETRHRENAARDLAFIRSLYDDLYVDGAFNGDPDQVQRYIYNKLGFGAPGYLNKPVSEAEIADLVSNSSDQTYTVVNQLKVLQDIDLFDALPTGDYVAFTNARNPVVPDRPPEQRQRRLIVNVADQRAGLKIAKALLPLFNDKHLERYFKQVKVFLSTEPRPDDEVKNDKLVLYYDVAPGEGGDAADVVGDQLAATIYAAIEMGDVDEAITPFYSELTPAVSWAEDPPDFAPGLAGLSFTQTRARAIALAVKTAEAQRQRTGETVDSPEDLLKWVQICFELYGIHPTQPHRHDPSTAMV